MSGKPDCVYCDPSDGVSQIYAYRCGGEYYLHYNRHTDPMVTTDASLFTSVLSALNASTGSVPDDAVLMILRQRNRERSD